MREQEEQPVARPIILLFDEFHRPLLVRYPPKKNPIGFLLKKKLKSLLPRLVIETI
jgi:hypothetical protein